MIKKKEDYCIDIGEYDETDISSILNKWKEIADVRKTLDKFEEMLKTKIKIHLKEKKWNRYMDEGTKISVTLSVQKRKVLDKNQLELILTPSQLAQVTRTTSFEKLSIITPEIRENLKKFVKKTNKGVKK